MGKYIPISNLRKYVRNKASKFDCADVGKGQL